VAEPLPLLIPHPRLHAPGPATRWPTGSSATSASRWPWWWPATATWPRTPASGSWSPTSPGPGGRPGRGPGRRAHRHDDVADNVAAHMVQEHGDARAAVAAAPHRLELDLAIERSASTPLEGRGVYARWDAADRSLRVYSSTQTSTSVRFALAVKLGVPVDRVEVVAPDVGGGFGVKIVHPWPEEVLVPWAAIRLGREVKWTEDRREHFVASAHERGQRHHVEVGFDDDGRLLGPGRPVRPRQRRLHPLRDHRPHHHRDPAPRPLQAGRLPGRVPLAVHQHRDRHPLPGRRPAPGGVRDGADPGRRSPPTWASTGPGSARPTSSSPTRCPTTTTSPSRTGGR
jgi:hypothetical protein